MATLLVHFVRLFRGIGYHVCVINCDQSAVNRKALAVLNIAKETPFCIIDELKVWGLFDLPHLFKSVRLVMFSFF